LSETLSTKQTIRFLIKIQVKKTYERSISCNWKESYRKYSTYEIEIN